MSRKVYLIPFDWKSFRGNHTAMGSYLAGKLKKNFDNLEVITMHSYDNYYAKFLNLIYIIFIALRLAVILRKGDKVFLMEYMSKSSFHVELAFLLKRLRPNIKIIGMVHLSGAHLLEVNKSITVIKKRMSYIDKCIVLGSSLEKFLREEVGYLNVYTTFHYVDTEYYKPLSNYQRKGNLNVLCIGATKRDLYSLKNIVLELPNVTFNICQGRKDLSAIFGGLPNVKLYGFLPEDELLYLLQTTDISLSVMEDTIGSNVITNSLAVGAIIVASDVGSIRDYCTEEESILCKTQEDFVRAIRRIDDNLQLLDLVKGKAYQRGQKFSYNNFCKEFKKMIIDS